MRSFFVDIQAKEGTIIKLPVAESKHACKVLRMQEGQNLSIVNGKGSVYTAKITVPNPKECVVKIITVHHQKPTNFEIHIAIAPTKNIDRFEWFLEKSTELGINKITPLLCSNSERKNIKMDRLNKVLIAAMKQSKRFYLPELSQAVQFDDFIKNNPNGLIAHCYDDNKTSLQSVIKPINCPILIGPEGDFTEKEVEMALINGFTSVNLGNTRLRTETAGLYACMLAKNKFE